MFVLDYIIIATIIISFFFGLLRGLYQEIISLFFLFWNFYFFSKYNYFFDFFKNSIQSIFLTHNILIFFMICFFFIIKRIINFYIKKIVKKLNVTCYNIFLGGIFGIVRGIILVYFILFILSYVSVAYYKYYIHHSILIHFVYYMYHFFVILN